MTTFVVLVHVQKREGSVLSGAIEKGQGETHLRSYLEAKMPAGSPVVIGKVVQT